MISLFSYFVVLLLFTHINLQLTKTLQLKLWRCMIMNGQMKRYKNSLSNMQAPILLSQYPNIKLDLRGLMHYAKEKGVKVVDLSEKEKAPFIKK